MNKEPIRVLLVDDHPFVRMGCRRLLEAKPCFEVVAEAADGRQAYFYFRKFSPDLVVMDVTLPDVSGIEITRKILLREPNARVLVCSMHGDLVFVQRALDVGALGYISKASTPDFLIDAAQRVANGKLYLDPDIARRLAEQKIRGDPFQQLTPREFEILRMVVSGRSSNDIGELLGISVKTVANSCTSLRGKLNVSSNMELFRLALQHGLMEL
jgi:DNA-binding NarL/FixJ family response regulator